VKERSVSGRSAAHGDLPTLRGEDAEPCHTGIPFADAYFQEIDRVSVRLNNGLNDLLGHW
jgi:hypothetical protein